MLACVSTRETSCATALQPLLLCRGASAAVIVYDITSSESFKKAQDWVKELQRQVRAEYKAWKMLRR